MKDWSKVIGEKHGMLTVLSQVKVGSGGPAQFLCRCDCGQECQVRYNNISQGVQKSCGCLSTTHGMTSHPVYAVWNAAMQRCHNSKSRQYPDYGARGIQVCVEWHDFKRFASAVGAPPFQGATLERVDNQKGYSPDNVVWADRRTQSRNKRNNRLFEFRGRSQILPDWAHELGLNYRALVSRIYNYGWSVERAFTTPIGGRS